MNGEPLCYCHGLQNMADQLEFVAGGLMFWTVIVNPVAMGLMTPGHDKMKDSFSALLLTLVQTCQCMPRLCMSSNH